MKIVFLTRINVKLREQRNSAFENLLITSPLSSLSLPGVSALPHCYQLVKKGFKNAILGEINFETYM